LRHAVLCDLKILGLKVLYGAALLVLYNGVEDHLGGAGNYFLFALLCGRCLSQD
jgi:hypothetical protein